MNIGPSIQRFRRGRELTLVELARRLDTHPSNVKRWETGRVSPRWETVVRIAEALGVPVEDLAAGQDTRGSAPMEFRMHSEHLSLERSVPGNLLAQERRLEFSQEDDATVGMLHEQTSRLADTHEQRAVEYRALSRFLRHPRFRVLREVIAKLPSDLTQEELAALSEVVEEFLAHRRQAGEK